MVTKIVIIGQNAQPWKEEEEKRETERKGEGGKNGGKERKRK